MTTQPAGRALSLQLALLAVLVSVGAVELGAGVAKSLFAQITPTTATWLRFAFAAVVLWGLRSAGLLGRRLRHLPPLASRRADPQRWWWAAGYAISLCGMNWSFYQSIQRLPLGIAVTIEYLGPLTLAIVGSRRRLDLVWAGLAGLGVALLGLRPAPLDPIGIVFALIAAACWAGYIALGSRARQFWDGTDLVALACTFGALVLAGPAIAQGGATLWTPAVLGLGALVGILSSVLPYRLDMAAFGALPPALFSILQSLAPAAAALAGWLVLGEVLGLGDWVALAAVVIASAGATITSRKRLEVADGPSSGDNGGVI